MPRLFLLVTMIAAGLCSGCAVCSHDGDYDYGMYGGSWVRHDPAQGRVGSAFYEAGGAVRGPEVIETPQEPTPIEEPRRYTPDEMTEEPASVESPGPAHRSSRRAGRMTR